jgi:hypothetical protein
MSFACIYGARFYIFADIYDAGLFIKRKSKNLQIFRQRYFDMRIFYRDLTPGPSPKERGVGTRG